MTQRKTDHITLAALSVPSTSNPDERFYYEPLLSAHPDGKEEINFLGKIMHHPMWISSMTGGSKEAGKINHLLAEACAEFGLGIGLGSCRILLKDDLFFNDFNLRPILGDDRPFYANLGVAQIEELIRNHETEKVHELVIHKLKADGLIIHVNPTQEWLQSEGDLFKKPPIETIAEFLDELKGQYPILVKEVGQGMGPESIEKLLRLDIFGLEFGAFGGTNFASIEIMRNKQPHSEFMYPLATFGHNAAEMLEIVNEIIFDHPVQCKNLIISGGIKNFLDGFYYTKKSILPSVYGMANVLLQHAMISRENLFDFIKAEIDGFRYASQFLKIKK
ncbi:MAG TPA: isopentenyl-diphosphate delta-isomerase [Prolixibacteraceae bacterium]|nr:isopentenyl-diphosphate delta-isomerase [Prolixibacteraceae bacterium]HPS11972.1 isopentenyl-diphosphate delta-isomerase [Prolixibacteraceae bacterium]